LKLFTHEIKRLEPISVSVYRQLREKEVDAGMAAIASFLGIRATKTEADKREQQILSRMFSLKDQQEQLYYYLGTIKNPREAIRKYNENVNDILGSAIIPQSMKDEWEEKLIINIDQLLSNKIYQLTSPMTTLTDREKAKEIEKINKYLRNFGVSNIEAKELLDYYFKQHPVKNPKNKAHLRTVRERNERLIDSFSESEIPRIDIPSIEIPEIPRVEIPSIKIPEVNLQKPSEKKASEYQRTILGTISDYAKAFTIDPSNAFKALLTKEKLGVVKGNLVELQRFYGIHFTDKGGSQAYKKKLMEQQGIPWSDKDKWKLEHIVPVKAGGDNSNKNLMLVNTELHDFFTPIDIAVGNAVKDKRITRKKATQLMRDFKVNKTITAEEVIQNL